jgi:hypothetical protein
MTFDRRPKLPRLQKLRRFALAGPRFSTTSYKCSFWIPPTALIADEVFFQSDTISDQNKPARPPAGGLAERSVGGDEARRRSQNSRADANTLRVAVEPRMKPAQRRTVVRHADGAEEASGEAADRWLAE